jgi:alanine-synthesizing transaminase
MRQTYKDRRDVLIESFAKAGWTLPKPSASMFVWAELPDQFKHLGSVEFAKRLMEGAEIAVAPGAGFGEYGDNFVRIALVENEQRIRQAARNLKRFLQSNAAPAAAE